jgi:hypothetical protein
MFFANRMIPFCAQDCTLAPSHWDVPHDVLPEHDINRKVLRADDQPWMIKRGSRGWVGVSKTQKRLQIML